MNDVNLTGVEKDSIILMFVDEIQVYCIVKSLMFAEFYFYGTTIFHDIIKPCRGTMKINVCKAD